MGYETKLLINGEFVSGNGEAVTVYNPSSGDKICDVAEATAALLASTPPEGVYHCVGSGMGTWMDLATHLAAELNRPSRIVPVQMASVKLKAKRPQFCALSNVKLRSLGIVMPTWQDAVSRYAKARLAIV